MKTKSRLFIGLLAFAGFALTAQAQKAYESFNTFNTVSDDTENGWYGGWTILGGTEEDNFSLGQLGSYEGKMFGSSIKITGGSMDRLLFNDFPDASGTSYWVSFFTQLDTPHENLTSGWHNGGLCLADEALSNYLYIGLRGEAGQDEVWSVLSSSNWTWYDAPVPVETGVPVWLVARIDMTGDGSDEAMYVWINPDNTLDELSNDDAFAQAVPVNCLNAGIPLVYMNCNATAPDVMELQYDEVRLGTSWAEVKEMAVGVKPVVSGALLLDNAPNPFCGSTTVSYTLAEDQDVKVSVYDAMGKEVSVLAEGKQAAGKHELTFSSEGLAAGLYICKLQAGSTVATKSMMVQ